MTKTILTAAAAAFLAVPAGALHAQEAQSASWIHVRVDEADGSKVRVNLPASLVDVALDVAGEEALEDGRLDWDHHGDLSLEEVRRLWAEVKRGGDARYVDVEDGDEHVRVFRRDGKVHVHVDEDGREKVRIEMPPEVADALLSGEGERLDLRAALRELTRTGSRELVRVQDEDATVRVWIDDRAEQSEEVRSR